MTAIVSTIAARITATDDGLHLHATSQDLCATADAVTITWAEGTDGTLIAKMRLAFLHAFNVATNITVDHNIAHMEGASAMVRAMGTSSLDAQMQIAPDTAQGQMALQHEGGATQFNLIWALCPPLSAGGRIATQGEAWLAPVEGTIGADLVARLCEALITAAKSQAQAA